MGAVDGGSVSGIAAVCAGFFAGESGEMDVVVEEIYAWGCEGVAGYYCCVGLPWDGWATCWGGPV